MKSLLLALLVFPGLFVCAESLPVVQADTHASALIGVWGGERRFGPEVNGTLLLSRSGSNWTAEIAGYRLEAEHENGVITFAIPGDGGAFRGILDSRDGVMEAQWIQPEVVSMFGQRFSTPVRLAQVTPDRWHGVVRPLSDRVRIFLALERGGDETVRAWLRNPELNFGRLFSFTDVAREGSRVHFNGMFVWRKDDETRELLSGDYRHDLDTLSVFIEDLGGNYDMKRIDPSSSVFYPRAWAHGAYEYHPPLSRDDGWETADLAGVGMATAPIEALVKRIIATPIDAIDAPYVDALLVARKGKLVVEEYFHGHAPDQPHDTRSASKSITAVIAGAGIRAGFVSLDTKVYETMLDGALPDNLDERARRITLEHLISMSSGLACDDWDAESPGGEDRMQNQSEQPDWYRYILDLPMAHEPDAVCAYCSGGMSLAGGVVARASGMLLTEFFERYVARPLQLGTYHTNLMPNREAYAGGGLRITGRDFLKFGQLMLNDGEWNGSRVMDEGWAAAALERRHELGTRVEGYGYGWWLFDYETGGQSWPAFYAGGNGGNYIIGVPALDLAVVFLASNYNQSVMHQTKYEYVPEYILRSILEGEEAAASKPGPKSRDGR